MTRRKRAVTLPEPAELERIAKGLATLDALLSEDWESRYYSFNAAWAPKKAERMASMRNGSGDEWFIVFSPAGAFLKSFWHEYEAGDPASLYDGLPKAFEHQLKEAAFSMNDVTFGGWCERNWVLRGDPEPMRDELSMLAGEAKAYCAYAAEYFELKVPAAAVTHVLEGRPLTAAVLKQLHSERTLADLEDDLREIGYGVTRR